MKRFAFVALLAIFTSVAGASEQGPTFRAHVDLGDRPSLQRGARIFVNYCLSCHSAAYMRYSRMGADLGLSDQQVKDNLMFSTDKIGSTMEVALRPDDAVQWFGVAPPDLSVIARARGADWLNTFFLGFYEDPGRATGVNNLAFKDTAMPHVLSELQGMQRAVTETITDADGVEHEKITGFELAAPGRMSEAEYRSTVRDLVNFLVYIGEPAKLERYRIGAWVMLFLLFFTFLAYLLKREYWKDVH
ncbi:MAG: cytochrome c1 [Gammaproteobacteria bacterium]|nr:cytochrome c1 [Gammaproteobacteria bacterium]